MAIEHPFGSPRRRDLPRPWRPWMPYTQASPPAASMPAAAAGEPHDRPGLSPARPAPGRDPNGYPATQSGIELRLLERLFTPDEARLACVMRLESQPPAVIAARLGLDPAEQRARR